MYPNKILLIALIGIILLVVYISVPWTSSSIPLRITQHELWPFALERAWSSVFRYERPLDPFLANLMESGLLKLKDHQVEYQMTRPSKENVCDGVDAVVYIMTMLTTDDTERRKVMRKLLFDKANLPSNHNVMHRYVVGRYPANRKYQQNLIDEMKAHDDIIFVNYEEIYVKNYIKWHAMHEWHMKHCPQAKTFIKIDDDTAIYLKRTFQWLDRDFGGIIKNTTEYFVCNALSTDSAPSRDVYSKWFVSYEQLDKNFVRYCSGPAVITTNETVAKLIKTQEKVRFEPVDDAFYTGIVREEAGVGLYGFHGIDNPGNGCSNDGLPFYISKHCNRADMQKDFFAIKNRICKGNKSL